jgi:hypothetical protein
MTIAKTTPALKKQDSTFAVCCYSINQLSLFSSSFFLLILASTRVWTQSLAFARQVLYQLSHIRNLKIISLYFQMESCVFVQGQPQTLILLAIPPALLGPQVYLTTFSLLIDKLNYWLIDIFFSPGLVLNWVPPDSASQAAGITDTCHHSWPPFSILCEKNYRGK